MARSQSQTQAVAVRGERDSHLLDNNDQRKFTISHSHLFSVNAPLKSVHIDDEEKANVKKIA